MNRLSKKRKFMDFMYRKDVISISFIVIFVLAALYIIFIGPRISQWGMHEGDIALKNVYAPYDFTYIWGIDEDKTTALRSQENEKVPYYLQRNLKVEIAVKDDLESFFAALNALRLDELSVNEKVSMLKDRVHKLSDRNLKYLIGSGDSELFKESVLNAVEMLYAQGYVDENLYKFLAKGRNKSIILFDDSTDLEFSREVTNLIRADNLTDKTSILLSKRIEDKKSKTILTLLIEDIIVPNLILSEQRTSMEREKVLSALVPVDKILAVEKNEIIIEKGKRVTSRHIAQISQLKSIFRSGTKPTFFFGILLLFLLLGLVGAIYLSFTNCDNILHQTKNVGIILLNMIGVIIFADFIVRAPPPSYFIPMASMGMILVLVVGFNAAFLAVLLLSLLISLLIGGGIELMLVLLIGSIVGTYSVKGARKRNRILLAGLFVGISKFMAIICIGLMNSMEIDFYVRDGLWGIASGIFSGFLVMGLLPLFEHFFKVTTNISLLELSDLNHSLLKDIELARFLF